MSNLDDITNAKRGAQQSLLSKPGVLGVGVGLREVNGQLTDEVVIRIYVRQKKPIDQLAADEVVPPHIDGHKTDVIERSSDEFIAEPGNFKERPMACGLQIARYAGFLGVQGFAGTIGCFVTSRSGPVQGDNLLLTCAHVLFPNLVHDVTMSDNKLYQNESILGVNCVGIVSDKYQFGGLADASFAYTDADDGANNYVWKIGKITGATRVKLGERIAKFGRTTGRTYGIVTDIDKTISVMARGQSVGFHNQIDITYSQDGSESDRFADEGDSGSAILNAQCQIVGLLWAVDESRMYGTASHINNVFDALDVKLAGSLSESSSL
jgi:hypothetical protein